MTVRVAVRLTPRAGADLIDGVGEDGTLRVRVSAPPVDGAANDALVRLLAAELGVGRAAVLLVGGGAGRRKLLEIRGIDPAVLAGRWPDLGRGGRA